MIKFPISKIVLEGCDLSGKTSLYDSIHKGSGFRWNIEDRSTLSMCIYANQYGRDDYYHRKNLELELSNLNNHMVLLHPDLDVIHNRYLDRGDEFQDEEPTKKIPGPVSRPAKLPPLSINTGVKSLTSDEKAKSYLVEYLYYITHHQSTQTCIESENNCFEGQ